MRETRDGRVYRPRHSGCLYKQKPKDDPGYEVAAWWVKVTHNGRPYYKSTGTANRREAERILKRELAKLEHGTFVEPKFERITCRASRGFGDALSSRGQPGRGHPHRAALELASEAYIWADEGQFTGDGCDADLPSEAGGRGGQQHHS